MRKTITVFTATHGNEVIAVGTNLTGLSDRLKELGKVAPHYNTLYKNFKLSDKYISGEYCFQKFSAGQNTDSGTNQATENTK